MDSESAPADRVGEEAFTQAMALARARLRPVSPADQSMQALSAAAFFAICAMAFCAAAVLAPPNVTTPAAKSGVR